MLAKFLSTPIGSWLKVFVAVILSTWLGELANGHDLFVFDIVLAKKLVMAAVVSTLPTIINYLNPTDPRYGSNKIQ